MTDTKPGADELRIRSILRQRGVGPDAAPVAVRSGSARLPDWWAPKPDIGPDGIAEAAVPPMPTTRPRDWLDDILDSDPAPASSEQPTEQPIAKVKPAPAPEPPAKAPKPRRRPAHMGEQHAPRQSLAEATARIPRRLRWLAYHSTAAGAGWPLGWVDWSTSTAAWYAAGHWTTPTAWVLYGLGLCACGLYRRSRTWAWPAAWAAAVPVSSIVLGVLLYAPNS